MRTLGTSLFTALACTLLGSSVAVAQPYDHMACFKISDSLKLSAVANVLPADPAIPDLNGCTLKIKAAEYCTPVEKDLVSFTGSSETVVGQDLTNAFLCYKLKCPAVDVPGVDAQDQFGSRTLSKFKIKKVCAPAVAVTTTTTTSSTTTTIPPECGDGVAEGSEACDGTDFKTSTCQVFGYPGGSLTCEGDCTINPTSCTPWTISGCRLEAPATITMSEASSQQVFARVVVPGITDVNTSGNDPHGHVAGAVCWGPDGSLPTGGGWTCSAAAPNSGYTTGSPNFVANEDEYVATVSGVAAVGSPWDYAFRFNTTAGPFVYCDLDGSSNGYSAAQAGAMTITP